MILARIERQPAAPTPMATIDSPRAMMMISPWRSTKCAGREPPPPPASDQRAEVVDRQGGDPQRRARPAHRRSWRPRAARLRARRRARIGGRRRELRIAAAGDRVEDEVERADEEIRDTEDEGIDAERRRASRGDDEHRRRRGEDGQADGAFFRIEGVRQPRIGRPCPPQRREQQQPADQPLPGFVFREEAGDLGDGEDEDEVEEQLERRDPLLALDRSNVHRGQISPAPNPAESRPADLPDDVVCCGTQDCSEGMVHPTPGRSLGAP